MESCSTLFINGGVPQNMLTPLKIASLVAQIENLWEQDGILFYTFHQWWCALLMMTPLNRLGLLLLYIKGCQHSLPLSYLK